MEIDDTAGAGAVVQIMEDTATDEVAGLLRRTSLCTSGKDRSHACYSTLEAP